jgi:hypothetical protein
MRIPLMDESCAVAGEKKAPTISVHAIIETKAFLDTDFFALRKGDSFGRRKMHGYVSAAGLRAEF